MAKKKKGEEEDPINEELNDDSVEDIEEADDNFGLPDVDFKTLDEASEEESKQEESQETVEEVTASSEEETGDTYSSYSGNGNGDNGGNDGGDDGDSDQGDEGEYKYEAPKQDSIAPKLIAFFLILIVAAVAVWYFAFYQPNQAEKKRIAEQEAAMQKARQDSIQRVEAERKRQQELAQQQQELEEQQEQEQVEPETGSVTILSERTSRYYVIIGSFVDQDLAQDYGNRLANKGVSTSVIPPVGDKMFYRLAIAAHDDYAAAQANADQMKGGEYGDNLWVLKY